MFAAIMTRAGRTNPRDLAEGEALLAALHPFAQPDVCGIWSNERALIVQGVHHNTPESLHERAPEVCAETGRVIAAWARLDNREELCAQLGVVPRADLTDPQLILAAHRRWGSECTARLDGDFSFIIHDPASGETLCGRDAIGARPFYYVLTNDHLIVATSVAAILAIRGLNLTPSSRWTALFAANMNFAHDQGAYDEVRKLPPAHDMVVRRDGAANPREYFSFDLAAPPSTRRDPIWVERYRAAFDRAVAVRARSHFLIGAESSGGLDSASIIATLAPILPHAAADFHTFAIIAMEREPELVEAVTAMCGVGHSHSLYRPELLRIDDAFQRALVALGHPPEHGQILTHPQFFEICAEQGIRTLVSGYGGDEVVTGYANHLMDELHHRRAYRAMLDELPGPLPIRLARLGKRLWRGPTDPDQRARELMAHKLSITCISREFLEDSGLAKQIEGCFLPVRPELTINTHAALEPGFRYSRAARLEASANFAASYGVEYRFPMYDRRLMQQFFASPSIEKRHREMGRYLHRRAIEGRIPAAINWQKTKNVGDFIGGRPQEEAPPRISFEDLPPTLRQVIDRRLLDQTMADHAAAPDDLSHTAMHRRLFIWHLRQLIAWLDCR